MPKYWKGWKEGVIFLFHKIEVASVLLFCTSLHIMNSVILSLYILYIRNIKSYSLNTTSTYFFY